MAHKSIPEDQIILIEALCRVPAQTLQKGQTPTQHLAVKLARILVNWQLSHVWNISLSLSDSQIDLSEVIEIPADQIEIENVLTLIKEKQTLKSDHTCNRKWSSHPIRCGH